jgi:hypothetical protein
VDRSAGSGQDQAQAALSAFFQAAQAGDRTAFQSSISSRDPAFPDRARQLFDNLRGLPLTSLTARLVPGRSAVSTSRQAVVGTDAWVQAASVTWRLGADTSSAEHTVWLTFVPEGVRTVVAGTIDTPVGAQPGPQPSWWLGPVRELGQGGVLVLVGAGQSGPDWLQRARKAAEAASEHLPAGAVPAATAHLVMEIPATTSDFEKVVGAAPGSYTGVAAVALAEGPTPRSALRVVVNPGAASRLSGDGLAVTLAHEIVHVVTCSAESPAPGWAVEGLADYVALQAYPAVQPAVFKPLLEQVRRSGPPKALPGNSAFAVDASRLDLAYAEAWSFWRYLAVRSSPAQLGKFYSALNGGRTVDQAATDVLHSSAAEVTAGWRRWLQARADQG